MARKSQRQLPWMSLGQLLLVAVLGTVSTQETEVKSDNSSRPVYRIATVLNEPWMMYKDGVYTGFIADLLNHVADVAGFEYQLQLSTEGRYGKMKFFTGEFDGIVGDLIKGEVDIAAADLIQTDERSNVVTFTRPFMDSGIRIMIKRPKPPRHAWYTLLQPLAADVWGLVLVAAALVGGAMFLIDRYSPYGAQAAKKGQGGSCWFAISDSYLFTLTTFLWQGYTAAPKSTSGRVLGLFWCVFAASVLIAYTANLTALILSSGNDKPVLPFRTFSEMASQSEVQYGGWFGMMLDTNTEPQASINRHISSRYTYYKNLTNAIQRIREADGGYAAIVEGYSGEHVTSQNCDLLLLRDELYPMAYSLACQKSRTGNRLCQNLTNAILKLREDGTVYQLIKRWWDESPDCSTYSENDFVSKMSTAVINYKALSLSDMAYAFIMLLVGTTLSIIILILEIAVCHRNKPKKEASVMAMNDDVDQNGV